jgi:PTS system ascorbate-specific IIA component
VAAVLLIAHAPLASALLSVADHVYSEKGHRVAAVDVEPWMTVETVEVLARTALQQLRATHPGADAGPHAGEVLILTDVFGATPCNAAQRVADGVATRLVTGVNVPMLWRSLCYLREPLDALASRAAVGASQGVLQVPPSQPALPDHPAASE